MFKNMSRAGLIVVLLCANALSAKIDVSYDKKIVAWDIHEVLCSKPGWHGYQCTPNQDTFEIVKALHEKGVKQVVFSNISSSSFYKLRKRYPNVTIIY